MSAEPEPSPAPAGDELSAPAAEGVPLRVESRPGETVVHLGVRPSHREKPAPGSPVVTGRIHGTSPQGPLVTWPGAERPCLARVAWMPVAPDWARCVGLEVALSFLDGDARRPLVVALLQAPPPPGESLETPAEEPRREAPPEVLRIESGRELVLECGKARIHLRADGRIEIRGEHLISRATGPNKIRGGSVQIN